MRSNHRALLQKAILFSWLRMSHEETDDLVGGVHIVGRLPNQRMIFTMKRTPDKTIASKARYWEKIIQAARRYPKGVTEYCRVMNVEKNNYY